MAPHAESSFANSSEHEMMRGNPLLDFGNGVKTSRSSSTTEDTQSSLLARAHPGDVHDIVCIGFGPAALAIAVAIHDSLDLNELARAPRICFLERQQQFAWHAGMQIPGATMQISWIKDLATIRNPRSRFTFLNYLHAKHRLLAFSNLGTFLPLRREYEDYMRWCSKAFEEVVDYEQEALDIIPEYSSQEGTDVDVFTVKTKNLQTGRPEARRARHVIIAGGGKPRIPLNLPQYHPRIIHSASYMHKIHTILPDRDKPYRVAVVGAGQSAAEAFNDLHSRYPYCQSRLIIKGSALQPSDDSPFVNEIFDPHKTDDVFNTAPNIRAADIVAARDTNYSVVRLELLEHIYSKLYEQRIDYEQENDFPHRVLNYREIESIDTVGDHGSPLFLHLLNKTPTHDGTGGVKQEILPFDAVILATGYERKQHESLLHKAEPLKVHSGQKVASEWTVSRNYRVQFKEGTVAASAGVWLQGCCEDTHGLSDTLLSVLATRAGEVVQSIFKTEMIPENFHVARKSAINGI